MMRASPHITPRRSVRQATEALAGGRDANPETYSVTGVRWIRYGAATLSLAAGVAHLSSMPEHYAEWWGYGVFFLVVGLAQVLLSDGLLYRPRQRLFLLGSIGNLAVITLYVVTRSVGIPFLGPHSGEVEPVAVVDLTTAIVETVLVIGLLALSETSPRVEAP